MIATDPDNPQADQGALYPVAVDLAMVLKLPAEAIPTIAAVLARNGVTPDELLTVDEAAAVLKCERDLVIDLCQSARLPALQIGTGKHRHFRIKRRDLACLRHVQPASRKQEREQEQAPRASRPRGRDYPQLI